ncbi:MAG: TatD family hydrolase [Synergistaceae bacterium]|nr:TatD family hydrolase [Synergistaceae bacterium]
MENNDRNQSSGFFFADTHCHVIEGREEYKTDAGAVLQRAAKAGVARMLLAGSNIPSSTMAVATVEKYRDLGVFAAVGVHPHDASTVPSCSVEGMGIPRGLSDLAVSPRVAAIGETGLDYHYDHSPRDQQKTSFRAHIRWSLESGLPLVVHGRESYEDIIRIFREEGASGTTGVIHCFSGTRADADFFLEAGYYLSFAGPLTFARNETLRELFSELPSDRILLETDSPYLAPVPFRGKKNEPALVRIVYETAADVRGISLDEIARTVSANASRLFRWGDPYFGEEAER